MWSHRRVTTARKVAGITSANPPRAIGVDLLAQRKRVTVVLADSRIHGFARVCHARHDDRHVAVDIGGEAAAGCSQS